MGILARIAAYWRGEHGGTTRRDSSGYKWPDTSPVDKTDKYWEFNNNMNCNGTPYKKAEVAPGKWQWVVNKEALQRQHDFEQHRRDLYWALRTRVLSDAEMAEVANYGVHLLVEPMVPYMEVDKQRELNDALMQQFKLRQAAK